MSAGVVIKVRRFDSERTEDAPVSVTSGENLEARYEQLMALVMRMGNWLSGPVAQLLPADEWESRFQRYQEQLEELRRLGDQLRPVSLRDRYEPLAGEVLVGEVVELFAA